jgi:DNA-binding beta-propeller fold protein YncE
MPIRNRSLAIICAALSMAAAAPQTLDADGVKIEFSVRPATGTELVEGGDAEVEFKVLDKNANTPLTGLHPAAWLDRKKPSDAGGCSAKIQSFLQASLSARADIDLNAYYVLALNGDGTITVVDPIFGYGGSKLLAYLELMGRGEDWRLQRDQKRLFVAMPEANRVAVVATATWKVTDNLDAGAKPARLALQPDEKYLWVGREGGVTVIDAETLQITARIETGAGAHEIAFSDDDRYAFVSNERSGTLSVISVARLAPVKTLRTGRRPVSLVFSSLRKSVYVADAVDGTIAVVDGRKHELVTRIRARGGLSAVRFAPGDRWGFAISPAAGVAQVFDTSTNRIVQTASVGKRPDQVTFTARYAFVRQTGSETVDMIDLAQLGRGPLSVAEFPGGQRAPGEAARRIKADAIVPSPEGSAVLVANPKDKTIYYYQEGMAAPMGNFHNYGHEPMAVMVVDRSLRETAPGTYSAPVRLTGGGDYDAALLLSTPRVTHCFAMSVKTDPAQHMRADPLAVEPLLKDGKVPVGKPFPLRFKLTDPVTQAPRAHLKDVRVLLFSPGIWQKRDLAYSVGDGIYEISVAVPQPGVYYVFYECPSLHVRFQELPGQILYAYEGAPEKPVANSTSGGRP